MILETDMSAVRVSRLLSGIALAAGLAAFAPDAAQASGAGASPQVASPHVAVPHVPTPGPGNISGCWSIDRAIYGPYHLSFCTNGYAGTYRVTGGLNCEGAVRVSSRGDGSVTVRLGHGRCNGRTDWSADYMECRPRHGGGWTNWQGGHSGSSRFGASPQVAVPRVPAPYPPQPDWSSRMDCTYYPVVAGYRPIGVSLRRN